MRKFLSCFFLIVILIFILTTFSNAFVDNSFIWSGDYVIETSTSSDVDLQFESASAILIEQNSGKILYEHNSHEQLRPASVTKVMSILLIMEALDSGKISLDDKVPCSEQAANMGGSQIWLDVREELTVNEIGRASCREIV